MFPNTDHKDEDNVPLVNVAAVNHVLCDNRKLNDTCENVIENIFTDAIILWHVNGDRDR